MTPWDAVVSNGPAGVLSVVVILIFLGYLVPRWWVRERIKDKNEEIARERALNDQLSASLRELLVYAEASNRILKAWYGRYEASRRRSTDEEERE
jgi:pilus assembly protein TadC